ncbi:hypothetical protein PSAB_17190 [Paenibacillus sabinae T27]|uniref:Uncharacterized protein n=1 Tax=Paenibacillus sabinae T27 TaxID=1268072 RepID=X5A1Y0_9BACL|nr:hypothetical protein PSAB_17190 [Paenibacillus sabinae T27]
MICFRLSWRFRFVASVFTDTRVKCLKYNYKLSKDNEEDLSHYNIEYSSFIKWNYFKKRQPYCQEKHENMSINPVKS